MPSVSIDADAYQDLARIRDRIDYDADDFYTGPNADLKFDELLVELERESRGIFETLWGDQTPLTETNRVDEMRAPDVAATQLVYPIQEVTTVEYKRSLRSDWDTLDTERWDATDHHLILADRPNTNALRHKRRGNSATDAAQRAEWADLAAKLRVTYDRGFGDEPPADILSIQVDLIANMLHARQRQQTSAAGSPDELSSAIDNGDPVTEDIRERIADVTSPGMATVTV